MFIYLVDKLYVILYIFENHILLQSAYFSVDHVWITV